MSRLFFPIKEVRGLIDHIQSASKHFKAYGQPAVAAIIFVKDDGIYLMSSGLVEGQKRPVAYAEGFDPNVVSADTLWDLSREAVGGDDFCEVIPLDDDLVKAVQGERVTRFYVDVTATSIEIGIEDIPLPKKVATCQLCGGEVVFKPYVYRVDGAERVLYRSPQICHHCHKARVFADPPPPRRAREKKPSSLPRLTSTERAALRQANTLFGLRPKREGKAVRRLQELGLVEWNAGGRGLAYWVTDLGRSRLSDPKKAVSP